MTLRDFNQLRLSQQSTYLRKKGTFLTSRGDDCFNILLFSVDSFFAELWIDTQASGVFTIIAFNDLDNLNFYAADLSITELIE